MSAILLTVEAAAMTSGSGAGPGLVGIREVSRWMVLNMSELYYKTLKNAHTGYTDITLRQLLDHLVTTLRTLRQIGRAS